MQIEWVVFHLKNYRSRVDRLIPICMIHFFNFVALQPFSQKVLHERMFSSRYANCKVFFFASRELFYNGKTRNPWAIFQ